jgi:hypothetical protein
MEIAAFFELSSGKWSSIKSAHHVQTTQQQSGKSSIELTAMAVSDPMVADLVIAQGLAPATCAANVTWDGTLEGNAKGVKGVGLLVAVAESPTQGVLLRQFDHQVMRSRYAAGEGGEITFVTEMGDRVTTERVWFESDNVRMRHTKVQDTDGKCTVAFCSEIRMMTAAPKT